MPLIIQRLAEGFTRHQIWQDLHQNGQISITKCKFYTHVNKLLTPSQPKEGRKNDAVRETASASSGLSLFPKSTTASAGVDKPTNDGIHMNTFVYNPNFISKDDW